MNDLVFIAISPELLIAVCVFIGVLTTLILGSTITACVQAAQLTQCVERLKQSGNKGIGSWKV